MEISELHTHKQYIKTLRRIIRIMDFAPGTPESKELETLLLLLKNYDRRYLLTSTGELVDAEMELA